MPDEDTRYDEGDEVATPDGPGVVAAVVTDDLEFPQEGDELTDVVDEDVDPLDGLPEVGSGERSRVLVVDRRLLGGMRRGDGRRGR